METWKWIAAGYYPSGWRLDQYCVHTVVPGGRWNSGVQVLWYFLIVANCTFVVFHGTLFILVETRTSVCGIL